MKEALDKDKRMALLEIKNLHAKVGDREILKGINLTVNAGEVHAIMGPNGTGKSTLAQVLAGRELYEVTGGEVIYDGKDLLELSPEDRAREGIFLAFQYPVEIPGREQHVLPQGGAQHHPQASRRRRTRRHGFPQPGPRQDEAHEDGPGAAEPSRQRRASPAARRSATRSSRWPCSNRSWPSSTRPIPAWISTRCAWWPAASTRMRGPERAMIVVTHYQRLLNYIVPDFVHVLAEGRIVKSGGKELALELEAKGYAGSGCTTSRRRSANYDGVAETDRRLAGAVHAINRPRPPGSKPLRERAFARFAELGFPTTHDEEWRFTNVAPIARTTFAPGRQGRGGSQTRPRPDSDWCSPTAICRPGRRACPRVSKPAAWRTTPRPSNSISPGTPRSMRTPFVALTPP